MLNYDNILLRTYFEIANNGDFSLLIVQGNPNIDVLVDCWEEIVKKNDKEVGSNKYEKIFKTQKIITKLHYNYLYIRTCLLKLYIEPDDSLIKELKKEGYIIDKDNYYDSIIAALNKSNHLITKITSKKNEIQDAKNIESKKPPVTFDRMIAELSVRLSPTIISDDITLARYNEYVKIAKMKESAKQK